jgi:SM-20-related protein
MTTPTDSIESLVAELGEHGWAVTDEFLADAEWRALAEDSRQLWLEGAFRQAGVGRGPSFALRPDIRRDRVCWLEPESVTPAQQGYLDRIEALRLAINRKLYLGLFAFEAHLTVYPPGAFYHRHLDRFRDAPHRTVSVILYLNSGWTAADGGALRLYPDDGTTRDILPRGGTLAVFLSDRFEHEVLPATRERMSITGWLGRRR